MKNKKEKAQLDAERRVIEENSKVEILMQQSKAKEARAVRRVNTPA